MADSSTVPSDLIWEIVRNRNSYLVKRKTGGNASYFSRDPLNLLNQHSRTHAGFVNERAVGVQPGPGEGKITLMTKAEGNKKKAGGNKNKAEGNKNTNRPAKNMEIRRWGKAAPNRKIYEKIARQTAGHKYRPDLRGFAVSRASAIRNSQRPKKETPERKPRGAKAKKAAKA